MMTSFDAGDFKAQSAGYLANHLARLFALALAQAIEPLGLAPAQFMTLIELWKQEGLTQAELVARLDVEQATMAATLNRMERDGLILRRPHPEDSRAHAITLTPKARGLEEAALAAARDVNALATAELSPSERKTLLELMARVATTLRRKRPERKPRRRRPPAS